MFYDMFEELCKKHGVSVSRAADESGVNKSSVTYWKKPKSKAYRAKCNKTMQVFCNNNE